MNKDLTIPSPETGRPVDGYIVIAPLSQKSKDAIYAIQDAIQAAFPRNRFWFPRGDQLHITFAHIVTPNVAYPEPHNAVWEHVRSQALAALKKRIPDPLAINVTFDTIVASNISVILKGYDKGTYDKLRKDFVSGFTLPEASRRPPDIIHTSIARFYDEIDMDQVQKCINSLEPTFVEVTKELQVIHETGLYVYTHDILARFPAHRR
jgi:hypothetical protein